MTISGLETLFLAYYRETCGGLDESNPCFDHLGLRGSFEGSHGGKGGWKLDGFSRWWQLKHFLFSPRKFGEDSQFDEHIFQRGWFNHQLVLGCFFCEMIGFLMRFGCLD